MHKSNKNHEYDCTRKCSLRSHGNCITAALTKRSIKNEKLGAFIAKTCCNYANVLDDLGRSAVHVAASVDRYALLEWLINQGGKINLCDYESGSTPLHRALFYGSIDCAVLLLRYGANLNMQDADTCCPLQNICRLMDVERHTTDGALESEILVWGSNRNYNLGIGIEDGPNTPQPLDFFRKARIYITKVAMGSFHSLFLDSKGNLYAAGHGKGGRLGNNNESSLPAPKKVKVPFKNAGEHITCISVSNKHSLVLTNRSAVFACGLNEDQQLGVRGCHEKLTVFKEVVTLRDLRVENLMGVIARDCYSVAFSNECLYYWGRNSGQFGIDNKIEYIPTPTQIKLPRKLIIKSVHCNDAAIVILTDTSHVWLFSNFKMRMINPPHFQVLDYVYVHGGDTIKNGKGTPSALKLLMVDKAMNLTFWYEKTKLFYRCDFSQIRLTQIDRLIFKGNQMLILSRGNVYKGKSQQVAVPSCYNEMDKRSSWSSFNGPKMLDFCKEHMIRIELERVPNVDRVLKVYANEDFNSFAVLQEGAYKYFKVPNLPKEPYNFKKLYLEAHEDDAIHDVVFNIDGETFPAHKLIIYARAPGLAEIVRNNQGDKEVQLKMNKLTGKIFELILKHIYISYLPVTEDMNDVQQSLGPDNTLSIHDTCQLFLSFAETFQVQDLVNYLKRNLKEFDSVYVLSQQADFKCRFARLQHTDFPELYDVNIICAGDIVLPAHKCILVARLEYFEMMFTHTWAEQSIINLSTTPIEYIQPMVEFIYNSDEDRFRKQNYTENFLYNMVVLCDQFLYERLRKVCERLLVEKITIRKCGDILDFACIYNCEFLRRSCINFICQNLARVLTQRTLENCEAESLKFINTQYRNMFKDMFDYRVITPNSEAIDDELLHSFVDDFEVDLDYKISEAELTSPGVTTKSKYSTPTTSSTRQHERDAISSMMKSLSFNENDQKQKDKDDSKIIKEAQEVDEKLQASAKSWMHVIDKKDKSKKSWRESAINTNKIVQLEKPVIELVNLATKQQTVTTPKTPTEESISNELSTAVNRSMNLADCAGFTPSREKLSQKQRKRLSSTSTAAGFNNISPSTENSKSSGMETSPPNAWGVTSKPSDWSSLDVTETGSAADPDSFANRLRNKNSTPPKSQSKCTDFMQIQAEERKQREHYERLRHKSLALTQIEETAITELRAFYNADNVTDEIITIERKAVPRTMNFAVWQKN